MKLDHIWCDNTLGTSHYFILVEEEDSLRRVWFMGGTGGRGMLKTEERWKEELTHTEYTCLDWHRDEVETFKLYLKL